MKLLIYIVQLNGYYSSKQENYYWLKLHFMFILDRLIIIFTVIVAYIDDYEALWELISKYHCLTILGDKVYIFT